MSASGRLGAQNDAFLILYKTPTKPRNLAPKRSRYRQEKLKKCKKIVIK